MEIIRERRRYVKLQSQLLEFSESPDPELLRAIGTLLAILQTRVAALTPAMIQTEDEPCPCGSCPK